MLFPRPPAALRVVAWFVAALVASLVADSAPAFDLEGHRGTRGLAPENTPVAFRRAMQIGVGTIETDMAATQDGVTVISHQPLLNPDLVRDPDGHWLAAPGPPIHALTLGQLRRYDVGRPIRRASTHGIFRNNSLQTASDFRNSPKYSI